ncbi:MAG TPA: TlpA disulfide reductase family protein [Candidatus Omnitrophota bacterium]|nr:TlpA disulfide reductase family protein [Candidatus Omnitrophota bacterium]
MEKPIKGTRLALVGAALALVVAVAVALWVVGPGRNLSYTGSPGNPSMTGGAIAALPAAQRSAPPALPFTDAHGRALDVAAFKGKVVLVNLWATWCPPCVAEMPSMDALARRLGGDRFQVVAVSLDRGGAPVVARWFERNDIKALGIYLGSSADYQGALLPTSYLIDTQGRVAWQGSGAKDWDSPEAVAMVEGLMAE